MLRLFFLCLVYGDREGNGLKLVYITKLYKNRF